MNNLRKHIQNIIKKLAESTEVAPAKPQVKPDVKPGKPVPKK